MTKYPFVYLLRDSKYSQIDNFFSKNIDKLNCTIEILSLDEIDKLNNMYDSNHHILITYGDDERFYIPFVLKYIADRMCDRWIHKKSIINIDEFNENVNYCYINYIISIRELSRPRFSIFTTCYKSYEKLHKAYASIKSQTLKDFEWVLLDDSPGYEHFDFLKKLSKQDKRIRLYKRDNNSGNIGNVKNEAVGLCRGKYLLELDHDDIILPTLLHDAYDIFESNHEIGFIYADFANIYENYSNFSYSDFICKGYGGYYKQKINNNWYNIYCTPNINNITASHLVCMPNHPRMWRRTLLFELGNYSEFLPICDDYEILLRTILNTKIVKIQKLGYIQFMNDNNNNFSLIRNHEINRLGPKHIYPQFFSKYNVNSKMKELNGYEDTWYINNHSKIWKRENYIHNYINKRVNNDYDNQYCLIGINSLYNHQIKELYKNERNDFILLDNTNDVNIIIDKLEELGYQRMKCYSLLDATKNELNNYFHLICKYTDNYKIIQD